MVYNFRNTVYLAVSDGEDKKHKLDDVEKKGKIEPATTKPTIRPV